MGSPSGDMQNVLLSVHAEFFPTRNYGITLPLTNLTHAIMANTETVFGTPMTGGTSPGMRPTTLGSL